MRTRVKFCGIRRAEDADAAVSLGADAIGLVMDRASARFIDPEDAAMIRRRLPPFVETVLLFRNAGSADVERAIRLVRPSLLQFHGEESVSDCERAGLPYLRAVPMTSNVDLHDVARRYASAAALLLDAHAPGEGGGQGRTFEWGRIPRDLGRPVVLAGGLDPANVGRAVRQVRPYAVDVSSGIEAARGVKDPARMRQFIDAVRAADEAP
jgi:phosphoribosylanthranilate isomerase